MKEIGGRGVDEGERELVFSSIAHTVKHTFLSVSLFKALVKEKDESGPNTQRR